ncbi:MAG: hypothetical protein U9Q96_01665 [Patescibacteria group bacterium]|nr:hypothetical protein [Patescibacteria group bacterium]
MNFNNLREEAGASLALAIIGSNLPSGTGILFTLADWVDAYLQTPVGNESRKALRIIILGRLEEVNKTALRFYLECQKDGDAIWTEILKRLLSKARGYDDISTLALATPKQSQGYRDLLHQLKKQATSFYAKVGFLKRFSEEEEKEEFFAEIVVEAGEDGDRLRELYVLAQEEDLDKTGIFSKLLKQANHLNALYFLSSIVTIDSDEEINLLNKVFGPGFDFNDRSMALKWWLGIKTKTIFRGKLIDSCKSFAEIVYVIEHLIPTGVTAVYNHALDTALPLATKLDQVMSLLKLCNRDSQIYWRVFKKAKGLARGCSSLLELLRYTEKRYSSYSDILNRAIPRAKSYEDFMRLANYVGHSTDDGKELLEKASYLLDKGGQKWSIQDYTTFMEHLRATTRRKQVFIWFRKKCKENHTLMLLFNSTPSSCKLERLALLRLISKKSGWYYLCSLLDSCEDNEQERRVVLKEILSPDRDIGDLLKSLQSFCLGGRSYSEIFKAIQANCL